MVAVESLGICTDADRFGDTFRCENRAMLPSKHTLHLILQLFASSVILLMAWASSAWAQEANVLGLPAIPQPKPGASVATPGAGTKPITAPAQRGNREAISGELGLQHSALNGTGRLIATTRNTFSTAGARSNALETALLVQRELAQACAKQCKPVKMAVPKILSSGQLEFELAFAPLHQHLSQAQFLAALQGKPLNLTPAQLAEPAAASATPASLPTTSVTAK